MASLANMRSDDPSAASAPPQATHGASSDQGRFRLLLDTIRDYAIFMLDVNGLVQTWNAGAERTKGYAAAEIVGRSFTVFYTPEDRARGVPEGLLRQAAAEERVEAQGWRVRKDGSRFWADIVITALHDPQGRLTGFAKVTRDLTERRRAEEELRRAEERFRLLVERVVDYAIFMLDPDGRISTWNVGGERIYGYLAPEIVGSHVSRLHPAPTARPPWEEELDRAEREGRFESEGWRVRKDGSQFRADVVVSAIRSDGGVLLGFSKVTRDLSDQLRLEEQRLEAVRTQEALRMRDEFLSVASHELRTPLTSLQLDMHALSRVLADAPPEIRRRLERANRGTRRLGNLVETLLDVSRISAGQLALRREAFDMSEMVVDVAGRLSAQAAQSANRIVTSVEGAVEGSWDRLRVEQVLTNLITNALRYAPASTVEVGVKREGDACVLTVSDDGPGIEEQLLSRLFERFTHGAQARRIGGMGLGLFISRQAVAAHGGSIVAENRPGGGAIFTVRLPVEHAPEGLLHS